MQRLAYALAETGRAHMVVDNDAPTLIEYLHKMQNNIMGMQIANRHFGRENLSFLCQNEQGVPLGYMLAYEGVNQDRKEVYVSDLAADPA